MRFVIRGAVLVGIGYGIGYVQGIKSGVKLGYGLEEFGEGLKELAYALAAAKTEPEQGTEEVVVDTDANDPGVAVYSITHVDEDDELKEQVRKLKTEGARTSGEIADRLGVTQEYVNQALEAEPSEQPAPQAS